MGGMTVDQIIKHFGSPVKAARALGYHRQAIYDWRKRGISVRTQKHIEFQTGGALKAAKK